MFKSSFVFDSGSYPILGPPALDLKEIPLRFSMALVAVGKSRRTDLNKGWERELVLVLT